MNRQYVISIALSHARSLLKDLERLGDKPKGVNMVEQVIDGLELDVEVSQPADSVKEDYHE